VAKITFTGSEASGQRIAATAAADLKRVTLELGGKSPQIVFDDARLDDAVHGVISGIFLSLGQSCIAGSRLLLQDGIHDRFVERLIAAMRDIRIGDPFDPATQVGPIATGRSTPRCWTSSSRRGGTARSACSAAKPFDRRTAERAGTSSRRSSPMFAPRWSSSARKCSGRCSR
jgi:acyl-CoA reductase-like NAD-dependent aldehyde dehydrogenase